MSKSRHSGKAKPFAKWFILAAVVSLVLIANGNVFATEGGGGAYPNGAEDFMAGALPPPGTYFINYLAYYTADRFNDKDGDKLFRKFELDVVANTFRFIHVTKHKILGGNWAVHAFIPLGYMEVERQIAPPFPHERDNRFSLGDIIIDPFILGWHWKNFHIVTGVDIYIPTGHFDEEDLANFGRNYWTFEPVVAFTYLSDGGFEVSSKFMYDFNTENPDTDYLSGQEFHFDYTVGFHIKNWSLGVGGYYYKQTTKDELNGEKFLDGFKGQAIALGPQVKYDYKNMSFTLKYQKEVEVKNKPEGDKFWFKFSYAF